MTKAQLGSFPCQVSVEALYSRRIDDIQARKSFASGSTAASGETLQNWLRGHLAERSFKDLDIQLAEAA
jgi:hypothetical protein